jgi:hypothetical protein
VDSGFSCRIRSSSAGRTCDAIVAIPAPSSWYCVTAIATRFPTPDTQTTGRLNAAVACAALLAFAWLTLRHVGESVFLEDQVDQLQNFESLLRLQPEGLWGAIMSGTVPAARALGPLGAVVFGVPVAMGLGVDAVHATTSLLIAMGTALCFAVLLRIDAAFSWLWLLVFSAAGVVWWNASLLWSNTLLLPAGLVIAALAAACLRRPDRATLGWLAVASLTALQLHLVAIVAVPFVVTIAVVTFREAPSRLARAQAWMLTAAAIVAVGPYLLAEAMTGGRNTRAIVSHLGTGGVADPGSALTALAIATDPTRLLEWAGLGTTTAIVVGTALVLGTLIWLGTRQRQRSSESPGAYSERLVLWLVRASLAAAAGQALFFLSMGRPFAGFHHYTLLAPMYAIVPAALVRYALFRAGVTRRATTLLGAGVLAVLVVIGPGIADRNAAPAPWSFNRIRTALETLCNGGAVETDEGAGFAAQLNPQYDSVLRYMMRRELTSCRHDPSSDVVIAAAVNADYPESKEIKGVVYRREEVLPPGLARYRRRP